MEEIILPVYDRQGKEIDKIKLNSEIFNGIINEDSIYQAVNAYRANQRKGLASTKTRGEVSGGGRKPWKQKGTGRARVGSTRSPLWRHGGVVFGPHPRDFYLRIPQKIKSLALRSSLNAKIKENNFIVLDSLKSEGCKTKEATKLFANLKINDKKNTKDKKVLLISDEFDKNSRLALRNISFLNINRAADTHAYEVLNCARFIITKAALSELTNRLKK